MKTILSKEQNKSWKLFVYFQEKRVDFLSLMINASETDLALHNFEVSLEFLLCLLFKSIVSKLNTISCSGRVCYSIRHFR